MDLFSGCVCRAYSKANAEAADDNSDVSDAGDLAHTDTEVKKAGVGEDGKKDALDAAEQSSADDDEDDEDECGFIGSRVRL